MKIIFVLAALITTLSLHGTCCCSNIPDRFPTAVKQAPEGMVWIPGGTFTMGSEAADARKR